MNNFLKFLNFLITTIGYVALIVTITALPVMLIWNNVLIDVIELPKITFWQAFWLNILCTLLFKDLRDTNKNNGSE